MKVEGELAGGDIGGGQRATSPLEFNALFLLPDSTLLHLLGSACRI
jgi:hypothetical protein